MGEVHQRLFAPDRGNRHLCLESELFRRDRLVIAGNGRQSLTCPVQAEGSNFG